MSLHIVEGNTFKLDGGALFGNVPKAVWEKWMQPDEDNRLTLKTRCLLLKTEDERNILFEAGIGAFFEPKLQERFGVESGENLLIKNLDAVGVSIEDVDEVVLSHLHFDHAGGILTDHKNGPLKLVFPNAYYYVSKMHWDHARHPPDRERASFIPEMLELLEKSARLRLLEKDFAIEPNITMQIFHGHTVGQMVSKIPLSDKNIYFVSDLIPGQYWVHAPISMGYDRYAELVPKEKQRFYVDLIGNGGLLFFYHDPSVEYATLQREKGGIFSCQGCDLL